MALVIRCPRRDCPTPGTRRPRLVKPNHPGHTLHGGEQGKGEGKSSKAGASGQEWSAETPGAPRTPRPGSASTAAPQPGLGPRGPRARP